MTNTAAQQQQQGKCAATVLLYGACSEHIFLQRSPGYYIESGYNRMRVDRPIRFEYATCGDGEIFQSGKKNLRIQKYPDTRGRGLRPPSFFLSLALFFPSSTTTESLEHASLKVPFHTNQSHFHTKGFKRGLVLKLRHRVTVLNIQIKISVFPYISLLNKR